MEYINDEQFLDGSCIHCDWQFNYYDEVKQASCDVIDILFTKGLIDETDHSDWMDFVEDGIEHLLTVRTGVMRRCSECYTYEDYLDDHNEDYKQ